MSKDRLKSLLKTHFGYDDFRLEQANIIQTVISGQDCLGIMPTGGGKSLCYQIPALYLNGVTLVVSPLISLMQDQVRNLETYGIKAHFLNSTLTWDEKQQVKQDLRNNEVKILYISPEGILATENIEFIKELPLDLIAIDEAHCVSQWGHEFRPDYTKLNVLKQFFPQTPVLALTATADEKTRKDIIRQLQLNNPEVFVSSFDRPNIKYLIEDRTDEISQLENFINQNHPEDTGIVYCLSRKKVEKVAEALNQKGYKAVPYHAGLSLEKRRKHQQLFDTEPHIIVVATIAFGMGIDRPDVRFVAHLDLPKSIEGYYQETGRAGRDGESSTAWMVYGLQDVVKHSQMLEMTSASEAYKKVARFKLDSMLSLCEVASCRRQYLLNYFAQTSSPCGNCDTCLDPVETWDATVDAQKVLSTIFRTGQIFGAGYIVEVLRGSKNAKVMQRSHHELSVHGIGAQKPKEHWNSIIRQLLNLGYIQIVNWDYRSLGLTAKSGEVLKSEIELQLRTIQYKKASQPKASSSKNKQKDVMAEHDNQDLFEKLRQLRRKIAEEASIPPYVVFSDKTLHEICVFLPDNADQFLMINGVGQTKLERYGEQFINEVKTFTSYSPS